MSMLFGRIGNESSKLIKNQLSELKKIMRWEDSAYHELNFGNFSGGVFYDPRLPYRFNDFYRVDYQNESMVLMSGVIYNREQLIKQLSPNTPITHDPELVLLAFKTWGETFAKNLNGDFAILIYNKLSNDSFFFRDHLGVRPLFFSNIEHSFWFSSDCMALCKALNTEDGIDQNYLINQLILFGLSSTPLLPDHTLLPNKKVQKLLPGNYMHISNTEVEIKKYWFPENIREDTNLNLNDLYTEIDSLLRDSIKIRSDQRFQAGAHLSGGLDSSYVASLVRKEYKAQREFPGFCWTSLNPAKREIEYDERISVQKLGEFIGVKPIFTSIDPKFQINCLSEWRHIADTLYENKVRENIKQNNCNLIFSGWGGDEFISINNIGIDSDLIFKFQWRTFLRKNPITKPKTLLMVIIYNVLLPAFSLRFYTKKKPLWQYSKYIKQELTVKPKTINDLNFWRSRREMHLRYLYHYHITERIEEWNNFGYRNGIEYRYPLIDKRIIEFMLKVPSKFLFKFGFNRILIRELSEGLLPEEIRWNLSKNDPVRTEALDDFLDEVCIKLMEELEEFKTNPELHFINFDLLINDLDDFRKGKIPKRPFEQFEILLFLKKAHEFTKAYYN